MLRRALLVHAALGVLAATYAFAGSAQPNPYRTIDAWLRAPAGRTLGSISSVAAARDGTVWIAERCGANDCSTSDLAPILHADADGNVLASFGAKRFAWPHGIRVDIEGNIWVADGRGGNGRGHQVLKLDRSGAVLLALGEAGVAGSDTAHFNGPTDVAIAPNGDVFVSDGHEDASNNRVLKFTRDGKFIKQWGGTGSKPGEFLVPHQLAFDSQGGCSSRTATTIESRSSIRTAASSRSGRSSDGRAACTSRRTTRSTCRITSRTPSVIQVGLAASVSAARATAR
jgi:hypothetical protein